MTSRIVELNVGGVVYATTAATLTSTATLTTATTLTSDADSLLSEWFASSSPSLSSHSDGRYRAALIRQEL